MKSLTDRTAEAFCALTLPKRDWTHWAHLRVGLWHLLRHSPEEALPMLRDGIRALNESHGVANTPTGGYHESITRFYVWRIATFLEHADRTRPVSDLAIELIMRYGDRNLPLQYWSKERLMSAEARLDWLEPDLAPLAQASR